HEGDLDAGLRPVGDLVLNDLGQCLTPARVHLLERERRTFRDPGTAVTGTGAGLHTRGGAARHDLPAVSGQEALTLRHAEGVRATGLELDAVGEVVRRVDGS